MQPEEILQQYWGFTSFRGRQKEIITSVAEGHDTIALLPTGGGKSVCYQVPALMKDGLCIVISPLIALMKDQVNNLQQKGIPALMIYSGMNYHEVKDVLKSAVNGNYKFLYVSPERLETNLFKDYVSSININLIAVDEAHCISQWGYDFRPPYLRIAALKEAIGKVPLLAVTASATQFVLEDIARQLKLHQPELFRQSFERKNLSYSIFKVDSKINKTLDILNKVKGSSIVYCKSRKQTKQLADMLQLQGINAGVYHAGLHTDERNKRQQQWVSNDTRVMVCTNAFGMGIDKPDVRTVIHYDVPDCIENYYQEAGRAGRDGNKSYAVLLYNEEDMKAMKELADMRFPAIEKIREVYQYLGDFLQIPASSGEGVYYDFDITEFVKNFHLDMILVSNALKALEQDGFIGYAQSVLLLSKVIFTTAKEVLFDFENKHPELEPLIKVLLRTYSGIYDHPVNIYENQLARLLYNDVAAVKNDLHKLNQLGIIQYTPQKDSPQVLFITNRAPAKHLNFNATAYNERKKAFEKRVKKMTDYMQSIKVCRSRFIANYFGQVNMEDCGVCDNCLQKKSQPLSNEEFALLKKSITESTNTADKFTVQQLITMHKTLHKEKVWQAIRFLSNEKKIYVDDEGVIRMTNKIN